MSTDLLKFCATECDPLHWLRKPWKSGQYVYASNGAVIARVPLSNYSGITPESDPSKHPDGERLFRHVAESRAGSFQPFMELPEPIKCERCHGIGWHHAAKCKSCDGIGMYVSNGTTYDCLSCGPAAGHPVEEGWVVTSAFTDVKAERRTCIDCAGTGYDEKHGSYELLPGGVQIRYVYAYLMSRVPNVLFRSAGHREAIEFKANGFEAIVMPVVRIN